MPPEFLRGIGDFNSRPSARGDRMPAEKCWIKKISIHAPPRGATAAGAAGSPPADNFNSRPSARGDAAAEINSLRIGKISIHAPPRGATHRRHAKPANHSISIHAPPRGATSTGRTMMRWITFQFTPLREGRQAALEDAAVAAIFQFTPLREGRRGP